MQYCEYSVGFSTILCLGDSLGVIAASTHPHTTHPVKRSWCGGYNLLLMPAGTLGDSWSKDKAFSIALAKSSGTSTEEEYLRTPEE
eukprot:6481459-Amphidinium_carterae.1